MPHRDIAEGHMNKNEIYKIYGTDYLEMTKELLERSGLLSLIGDRHKRIGIKPNLVSPTPPIMGATTHREVLAGIIEYLQEGGVEDITIMEGSSVGCDTMESFEVCGYQSLIDDYGVRFVDAQQCGYDEVETEGLTLKICRCVQDVDFMINVPVMKGHCQTRITCALKNMKGLVPGAEKRHFHAMGLHNPIGHLSAAAHQDFVVVDHICGDLDFEEGGNPVECNCVFTGIDPVLIDSYVCQLMGIDVSEVPYIGIAESLGLGSTDLEGARIVKLGRNGSPDIPAPAEDLRVVRKIVEIQDVVEQVDSCSSCYGTLIPVMERLKDEGRLEELLSKIPDHIVHIGQGFRGKSGCLGVGNCTRLFEHSVKGCPPKEEDIYRMLINYLHM